MTDYLKEEWTKVLIDNLNDGYFIVSTKDIFSFLDEHDIHNFNYIMEKIIKGRISKGKNPMIKYKKG